MKWLNIITREFVDLTVAVPIFLRKKKKKQQQQIWYQVIDSDRIWFEWSSETLQRRRRRGREGEERDITIESVREEPGPEAKAGFELYAFTFVSFCLFEFFSSTIYEFNRLYRLLKKKFNGFKKNYLKKITINWEGVSFFLSFYLWFDKFKS